MILLIKISMNGFFSLDFFEVFNNAVLQLSLLRKWLHNNCISYFVIILLHMCLPTAILIWLYISKNNFWYSARITVDFNSGCSNFILIRTVLIDSTTSFWYLESLLRCCFVWTACLSVTHKFISHLLLIIHSSF